MLGAPGIPGVVRGHEVRRVALPGEGCQQGHQHCVGTRTMEMTREAPEKEFYPQILRKLCCTLDLKHCGHWIILDLS